MVKLALPLLAVLMTGCAAVGTERDSRADALNFSLKSSDTVSGSLNAASPDDKPSSGQFF
jgi:hypothetical protein